jgi:hypothetical protein
MGYFMHAFAARRGTPALVVSLALSILAAFGSATTAAAQDRLKSMPGYEQYQRMAPQIAQAVRLSRGFGATAPAVW